MSDEQKHVINDPSNYVFGDVELPLKTSLAWNGEARSNKEIHNVTILINMKGVTLEEAVDKTLSQKAVDFQRSRRAKDSNGVFETRESFEEYCDQIGAEVRKHFEDVGKAPQPPKSDEELELESEKRFEQMSPETQLEHIQRLQKMAQEREG